MKKLLVLLCVNFILGNGIIKSYNVGTESHREVLRVVEGVFFSLNDNGQLLIAKGMRGISDDKLQIRIVQPRITFQPMIITIILNTTVDIGEKILESDLVKRISLVHLDNMACDIITAPPQDEKKILADKTEFIVYEKLIEILIKYIEYAPEYYTDSHPIQSLKSCVARTLFLSSLLQYKENMHLNIDDKMYTAVIFMYNVYLCSFMGAWIDGEIDIICKKFYDETIDDNIYDPKIVFRLLYEFKTSVYDMFRYGKTQINVINNGNKLEVLRNITIPLFIVDKRTQIQHYPF